MIKEVSKAFQANFKDVSRECQECFKGVSRVFQRCFKELSRKCSPIWMTDLQEGLAPRVSIQQNHPNGFTFERNTCQSMF